MSRLVHAGAVYRKADEDSRPSLEEVLNTILAHVGAPFEDAYLYEDDAERLFEMYRDLMEPIPIWRVVECEDEHCIDLHNPGSSWTYDRDAALAFAKSPKFYETNLYLLSGSVFSYEVDWEASTIQQVEWPDEKELVVPQGVYVGAEIEQMIAEKNDDK